MATPDKTTRQTRARRYKRIALWTIAIIVVGAMVLPLGGYVYTGIQSAHAQAVEDSNPRANYWRAVRGGDQGYTSVEGQEAGVLMQEGGQNWRQIRNGPLANYGGWGLFLIALAILLFFGMRGRINIEKGRSGKLVKRWSSWERFVHWYTAILFVLLAITGLSILFGRAVLIPLLGPRGFAAWADIAIGLHNIAGPAFSIGVLVMIIMWIPNNLPSKGDGEWLSKAGGIFSDGTHPPAGKANAGEKIWFWIICTVGVAVVITGFILDFPNFGQTRDTMQLANIIHGAASIVWVGVWFGHAYIGTVGTEGALEGMTTGYVDANWAKQHHDIWYDEIGQGGGTTQYSGSTTSKTEAGGTGEQPA
ncbi:MAG: formate dehydrogenase subunit gamma [Gammaproteobacteria bacterium]|nr:MAG: formate dehydrogenase subunit gamma [Gammaproteobacteria bacterium]